MKNAESSCERWRKLAVHIICCEMKFHPFLIYSHSIEEEAAEEGKYGADKECDAMPRQRIGFPLSATMLSRMATILFHIDTYPHHFPLSRPRDAAWVKYSSIAVPSRITPIISGANQTSNLTSKFNQRFDAERKIGKRTLHIYHTSIAAPFLIKKQQTRTEELKSACRKRLSNCAFAPSTLALCTLHWACVLYIYLCVHFCCGCHAIIPAEPYIKRKWRVEKMQITTKRRLFGELLISVKLVELAPVLSWHYATKTKRHNITLKDKIRSCGDTVVCIIAQPHEMCSRMAHSRPQIFAAMSLFQLGKGCCLVEHGSTYLSWKYNTQLFELFTLHSMLRLWWKGVGVPVHARWIFVSPFTNNCAARWYKVINDNLNAFN